MLIAIDMDNLKYYNDSYGHQEGDALLTLLANTARQNLRQTDLIIRTGGDEFILLLKDMNLPEAENIILRIRQQFIRAVLDERIDFSYGIVSIQDSLEITMRKADEKMYQMKRARKNLVLVADSGNKPAYNRSRQPG